MTIVIRIFGSLFSVCVCVFVTVVPFLWFIFITLLLYGPHNMYNSSSRINRHDHQHTSSFIQRLRQFATIATNIPHLTRFTHAFCMHLSLVQTICEWIHVQKDSQCIYRIKYCGFRVEKAIKASSSDGKRNIFEDAISTANRVSENITTTCGQ